MNPTVSFVVPCYKLAHLLPECINSILAQTFRDFEVLIMDNCSPDRTAEVARSFDDPRVKHIRNDVNLGHLRNFNKGITMSVGKYVWLISADDTLRTPYALERFVDLMERHPSVGYVFCRAVEWQDGKERAVPGWADCGENDRIWDGRKFLARLIRRNCVVFSSVMVRRLCYETITLFPLDMPHASDWYMWCLFALRHDVAYLSEPMVRLRLHEQSLTTLFTRENAQVFILDELAVPWRVGHQAELAGLPALQRACRVSIAESAVRALHSKPGESTRHMTEAEFEAMLRRHVSTANEEREIRAHLYVSLGDHYWWDGEYQEAAHLYWLGLKLRPWWLKSWVKYLLTRTGFIGISIRRILTSIAVSVGLKQDFRIRSKRENVFL